MKIRVHEKCCELRVQFIYINKNLSEVKIGLVSSLYLEKVIILTISFRFIYIKVYA